MKTTVAELARILGGKVEGAGDRPVETLSKIEEAGPKSLSFLANPKYEEFLYTTQAAAVLVERDFAPRKPVTASLIRVANPYEAFIQVLKQIHTPPQRLGIESPCHVGKCVHLGQQVYVGAFSYIGDHSHIGDKVKIYPQVYIGEHVKIGEGTIIYPGVRILDYCEVGRHCIIHANAVIGSDGFGFAPQKDDQYVKIPQVGNVVLEDDVEVGANTTIDRATLGSTVIRRGVKLDNLIQVAHNVEIGEHTVVAAQSGIAGSTRVGRRCSVGGQVGIIGHLTIADDVKIAAQSGVGKSITKPGSVVQGSPAFCINDYRKCYVLFRKLPELQARLENLSVQIQKAGQDEF
ncbi:MAG: UDP-3-O-(3-hydroxymyristoyl)glucosamine N-acyltransferase [Flavobacteriales bacterium]|nr:UDP-3-O-(3-hydroxymyristoyl)glucosamine N-acyltransferase [Flavobacteriales bacterium]MDW8432595.1 UDP-3-O-(3-hydroxymyristoyl)glucosamine N-acyltransferase [Flavobacteriales bacterium]